MQLTHCHLYAVFFLDLSTRECLWPPLPPLPIWLSFKSGRNYHILYYAHHDFLAYTDHLLFELSEHPSLSHVIAFVNTDHFPLPNAWNYNHSIQTVGLLRARTNIVFFLETFPTFLQHLAWYQTWKSTVSMVLLEFCSLWRNKIVEKEREMKEGREGERE